MSHDPLEIWNREFQAFTEAEGVAPPLAISSRLLKKVRHELNPSAARVAARLLAIHAVAGSATLLVCPQFGLGPIGGGHGLMGAVMDFGPMACAAFCGFVFLSLTALTGLLLLRPEEARVVVRNGWWQFSGLAGLSMGLLMLFGGTAPTVDFGITWLLSGVLGASLLFAAGARGRYAPTGAKPS